MKCHRDRLLAIPARRALQKLGEDLRDARRLRRITMDLLAERAQLCRTALTKVEPTLQLGPGVVHNPVNKALFGAPDV